jgi:hypothetical protein
MVKKKINGIRGWLLLFVIISTLSLINLIYRLCNDFLTYLGGGMIGKIMLIGAVMSILLTIIYLTLIFQKSRYAVFGIIIALLYDMAINFTLFVIILNIAPSNRLEIYLSAGLILFNLAWVLYFNFSNRVRNTFNL